MTLYTDALNYYETQSNSLTFTWQGNTYFPYDFIDNVSNITKWIASKGEQDSNITTFFPPHATLAQNISNSDFNILFLNAYKVVQQCDDTYLYILTLIGNGTITDSSQIATYWTSYNSTYVNPRIELPSFQSMLTRTPNIVSRSLNSSFQISTTQDCLVFYTIEVLLTLSLTLAQKGTIYLEYADDSGFTQNVTTICKPLIGFGAGLTLTLTNDLMLSGFIPKGKYVKLITEQTQGTPAFTYKQGQEVLFY